MADEIMFPDWLRCVRKRKGITQEELAVRMGVSAANISQYENGKRRAKPSTMLKFYKELIKDDPPATVELRTCGRWIEDSDPGERVGSYWSCSVCGVCWGPPFGDAVPMFNYCPNCGSNMKEVKKNDERNQIR